MAYLYDEATAAERASFESHLPGCNVCRDELPAFRRVRDELGVWQVGLAPRTEIRVARGPLEVLRELFGLFPLWARAAGAAAAAAAVLFAALAVSGTRIDAREGTIEFGLSAAEDQKQVVAQPVPGGTPSLTREEIERMIEGRVTEARAFDAQRVEDLRIQLASLKSRLATADQSQTQLRAQITSLRAEQRALIARGQSTLGEWLFAVNESRESWGGDSEKDN